MEFNFESECDLQRLIGQYESVRLDFKQSILLTGSPDDVVENLTKEVSAFANTEGGIIVIGIKEGRHGKKSVADEIDNGVDPAAFSPDRLEQLIAANMSPPVPGLCVRPIPLSGTKSGRVAFVIKVPKGNTAYQAIRMKRYYGRREFASEPLLDNDIRGLMLRAQVPHATIALGKVHCLTAEADLLARKATLTAAQKDEQQIRGERRERLKAGKRDFDEYSFGLAIHNDGPFTIRDCILSVTIDGDAEVKLDGLHSKGRSWQLRFAKAGAVAAVVSSSAGHSVEKRLPESKLFPEQIVAFPGAEFTLTVPAAQAVPHFVVNWTLYLDDGPPSSGVLDVSPALANSVAGQTSKN